MARPPPPPPARRPPNARTPSSSSSSTAVLGMYSMFRRQVELESAKAIVGTIAPQRNEDTTDDPIEVYDSSTSSTSSTSDVEEESIPLSALRERLTTAGRQESDNNKKRKASGTASSSLSSASSFFAGGSNNANQNNNNNNNNNSATAKRSRSLLSSSSSSSSSRSRSNNNNNIQRQPTTQLQLSFAPPLRPSPTSSSSRQEDQDENNNNNNKTKEEEIPDFGLPKRLRRIVCTFDRAEKDDNGDTEEEIISPQERWRRIVTIYTEGRRNKTRNYYSKNILFHLLDRTTNAPTTSTTTATKSAVRRPVLAKHVVKSSTSTAKKKQISTPYYFHAPIPTTTHFSRHHCPWTVPKSLKLVTMDDNNNNHRHATGNNSSNSNITHICWDAMGVLLTVATSNNRILVYDWDMVRAADVQGKQRRRRRQHDNSDGSSQTTTNSKTKKKDCFQIPPILTFAVPHAVSCLKWNPYDNNVDTLAVGFRHSGGKTHLYDVNKVSEWTMRKMSSQQQQQRRQRQQQQQQQPFPPSSTYDLLQYPRSAGSVEEVAFLKQQQPQSQQQSQSQHHDSSQQHTMATKKEKEEDSFVLVAVGNMIYCYKKQQQRVSKKTSITGTSSTKSKTKITTHYPLFWRCQFGSPVTSVVAAAATSNFVIVGTKTGRLCVLDWTQRTRERAFSMEYRPILLLQEQRLVPLQVAQQLPRGTDEAYWKIVKLQVDVVVAGCNNNTNASNISESNSTGSTIIMAKSKKGHDMASHNHSRRTTVECRIRWVTASGWVLATRLKSTTSSGSAGGGGAGGVQKSSSAYLSTEGGCQILYEPPKVRYFNSEGTLINVQKSTWSNTLHVHSGMVVTSPCTTGISTATPSELWFPQIPAQTKTLAPHDKYVLARTTTTTNSDESSPSSNNSNNNNDAFYLQHEGGNTNHHTTPLALPSSSSSLKERPHVMAVHEGREWMVLGIGKRLVVLAARK